MANWSGHAVGRAVAGMDQYAEKAVWEVGHEGLKGGHEWFDIQHAKSKFLGGSKDSEDDPWGQSDSRMLEMPEDSQMLWESDNEEVHYGYGIFTS